MLSRSRQSRPDRCPAPLPARLSRRACAAFTLVEICIALAVIGTISSGCFVGFNSITNVGVAARLYSEAQTAAQNQIDLILSKEPFDLLVSPKIIPLELMTAAELGALSPALGTTTPATTDQYYPYYLKNGLLARDAFIYTDPTTGTVLVKGIVTTTVTETGTTQTLESTSTDLNLRRVTVVVSYTFRNTTYTDVTMDTMRTADR